MFIDALEHDTILCHQFRVPTSLILASLFIISYTSTQPFLKQFVEHFYSVVATLRYTRPSLNRFHRVEFYNKITHKILNKFSNFSNID